MASPARLPITGALKRLHERRAVSTSTLCVIATTLATPTFSSSEATDSDAFSACAVWQASRKTSGMRWSRRREPSPVPWSVLSCV
jgi:hypothetical protein